MTPSELENRLIKFAVVVIKITEKMSNSRAGATISNQIVRSCTSPALNYGEAQAAESENDFIHKNQIVLKELRETFVGLKIIKEAGLTKSNDLLDEAMKENNELISIFVSTVKTLKNKKK